MKIKIIATYYDALDSEVIEAKSPEKAKEVYKAKNPDKSHWHIDSFTSEEIFELMRSMPSMGCHMPWYRNARHVKH
jgi:hypothetical protein